MVYDLRERGDPIEVENFEQEIDEDKGPLKSILMINDISALTNLSEEAIDPKRFVSSKFFALAYGEDDFNAK